MVTPHERTKEKQGDKQKKVEVSGKRPTIKQNGRKVVTSTQSTAKAMIEKPPHTPLKIDYGDGWSWIPDKDYFVLNDGEFIITAHILDEYMKNWGRRIERVHILAVLQKLYRLHFGL